MMVIRSFLRDKLMSCFFLWTKLHKRTCVYVYCTVHFYFILIEFFPLQSQHAIFVALRGACLPFSIYQPLKVPVPVGETIIMTTHRSPDEHNHATSSFQDFFLTIASKLKCYSAPQSKMSHDRIHNLYETNEEAYTYRDIQCR
jgi:hypothetical protein